MPSAVRFMISYEPGFPEPAVCDHRVIGVNT
jgi:hypothetical protein